MLFISSCTLGLHVADLVLVSQTLNQGSTCQSRNPRRGGNPAEEYLGFGQFAEPFVHVTARSKWAGSWAYWAYYRLDSVRMERGCTVAARPASVSLAQVSA